MAATAVEAWDDAACAQPRLRRRPARIALRRARLCRRSIDGAAAGLDFACREVAARSLADPAPG